MGLVVTDMNQALTRPNFKFADTRSFPLSLLRILCLRHEVRISFTTRDNDRYLINRNGCFIELPDKELVAVSPRTVFGSVDRIPSVDLSDLVDQGHSERPAYFICEAVNGDRPGGGVAVEVADLLEDLHVVMPWIEELPPMERYVGMHACQCGLVQPQKLSRAVFLRRQGRTLGQILLSRSDCTWQEMLGVCLDTRRPSDLDPPEPRALASRIDWERIGEILITLGKITRTQLECALKAKREGSQELGRILIGMGACSKTDILDCLRLQQAAREVYGAETSLLGDILIAQGVISEASLQQALRDQQVGRQSLERILISMGACTQYDIDDFVRANNWHSFEIGIDDFALGHWLLKVATITSRQLEEALRIQERGRQMLGDLLVSVNLCSREQVDKALATQSDLRKGAIAGVPKIGMLLIRQGKLTFAMLDKTLSMQAFGRQPVGDILVAMAACSADDVNFALGLQARWRELHVAPQDLIGDLLLANKLISHQAFTDILPLHTEDRRSLGRVAIEAGLVSPEQVIEMLLERERRHQEEFLRFLRLMVPGLKPRKQGGHELSIEEPGKAVLNKLASWLTKRPSA